MQGQSHSEDAADAQATVNLEEAAMRLADCARNIQALPQPSGRSGQLAGAAIKALEYMRQVFLADADAVIADAD